MSERKNMSEAYFTALDLPQLPAEQNTGAKKAALDRAHELRKFEIENYWKRATYFWSFQVIAFAVLGFSFKDGKPPEHFAIIQIPAALGAISGLVAFLSAKGSKFWQENWEAHVDLLEREIEGRLTQAIWSDGKRSNSVSRLNHEFMRLLTLGWLALMTVASFPEIQNEFMLVPSWVGMVTLLAAMAWLWCSTLQNLNGFQLNSESWLQLGKSWKWDWKRQGQASDTRRLQLRDTKAFDADMPSNNVE